MESEGKAKRVCILTAATEAFTRYGFYKATIEDIAQLAGVGKGTVYEYFKSKSDLFFEMINFNIRLYEQKLRQEIDSVDGFTQKLQCFVEFHQRIAMNNAKLIDTMLSQQVIFLDDYIRKHQCELAMRIRSRVIEVLSQILHVGQIEKKVRDIDREFAADLFFAMVIRCCVRGAILGLDNDQIKKDRELLIDLFIHGIT